ncbi:cytochrome P450, partial [Irpex lacteus]
VFYEILRLYAPVPVVPKMAADDCVLYTTNMSGHKIPVNVPRNSAIFLHIPGLHHDPKYWEHPHEFNPSRFLEPDWPRDASLPFSGGARSFIARRYIKLKDELQFAHESFNNEKPGCSTTRPH